MNPKGDEQRRQEQEQRANHKTEREHGEHIRNREEKIKTQDKGKITETREDENWAVGPTKTEGTTQTNEGTRCRWSEATQKHRWGKWFEKH